MANNKVYHNSDRDFCHIGLAEGHHVPFWAVSYNSENKKVVFAIPAGGSMTLSTSDAMRFLIDSLKVVECAVNAAEYEAGSMYAD